MNTENTNDDTATEGCAPAAGAPFYLTLEDITLVRLALDGARYELQNLIHQCIPRRIKTLEAESAASMAKVAIQRLDDIRDAANDEMTSTHH